MRLTDIFRKKESGEDAALRKKLEHMKCKLVNYEAADFAGLCSSARTDEETLLRLVPVNYYAIKNEYIEAAFYSDEEHEENYVLFRLVKNDRPVSSSGIYPVSKDTLRRIYMKLGAVNF